MADAETANKSCSDYRQVYRREAADRERSRKRNGCIKESSGKGTGCESKGD